MCDKATRNPNTPSPRFRIRVHGHDRDDAPGWHYKLLLIDRAWLDPEGFAVDAIAAGESWPAAFRTAVAFMANATRAKDCVFY
jgi:hypothetical protein